ncbi:MAG TPA: type 1 glutamine amidotransferase domain-containing protein [Candidatus Paceibacterota bacterium]|nr:type 1 glutamine amidotransferase domain-containing protein [Candidatus Paceibacterota bacterium]
MDMEKIKTLELEGKIIAILATNGFENVELVLPKRALEEAGATVHVVSPQAEKIQGVDHLKWREDFVPVDYTLKEADPDRYDALMLPGGVINPDLLRLEPSAIEFIKSFVTSEKPIAAICHGPWTLINANAVTGKKITSWPTLRADLENAGAIWVDEETALNGKLLTSRKPDDIPAFNREMISLFGKTDGE